MAANNKGGDSAGGSDGPVDGTGLRGELVALMLRRLEEVGCAKRRREDVQRALDKRRRKWRNKHHRRNKATPANPSWAPPAWDPELKQEKETLSDQCSELGERLVGRRSEAYNRAREERTRRDTLRRDTIGRRLESAKLSLEGYREKFRLCLATGGTTGERESCAQERWGEELLKDLNRNLSQAKALASIRQMKLHMTPRLPALPPLPVTPGSVVRPDRTSVDTSGNTAAVSVADGSVGVAGHQSHSSTREEDSSRVEEEKVVVVEVQEKAEEEVEEKEEEVVAEVLYEDKVPDIARVVEGTSEELNSISGSQHGADDSLFYIHQSTGHADSALTHREAVNSARSPSVTMQEHNYSQAFSNGTADHAATDAFDTPMTSHATTDTFDSAADIDISVVELSVITTVSPMSDPLPQHEGTQSHSSASKRGDEECNGHLGNEDAAETIATYRGRGRGRGSGGPLVRSRGRRKKSRVNRRNVRGGASGVVVQPEPNSGPLDTLNSIVPEMAVRPQKKRPRK